MQDFILHTGVAIIQLACQEIISETGSAGFGKANFIKGNTSAGAEKQDELSGHITFRKTIEQH